MLSLFPTYCFPTATVFTGTSRSGMLERLVYKQVPSGQGKCFYSQISNFNEFPSYTISESKDGGLGLGNRSKFERFELPAAS